MVQLLIIDSERSIRNILKEKLEYEGFRVDTAQTCSEAEEKIHRTCFDVILCDLQVPEGGAVFLLHSMQERGIDIPVIVLSSRKEIEPVVNCMRLRAVDYQVKPINMNQLLDSIHSVTDQRSQNRATLSGKQKNSAGTLDSTSESSLRSSAAAKSSVSDDEFVGSSPAIMHVKGLIDKVAPSNARVLILGANGTGKELVAQRLHKLSLRKSAPFVEVNCAAIPSELIESELFGYEKGSFTSANRQHKGKFEQADGGTLFLDEIGDMSHSAQAKVLRALQESRICRVGSDKDIVVNVRVVAATNKNLLQEIQAGNFREDLYHRLSVVILRVPPLRERKDDIPLLTNYFIDKISVSYKTLPKIVDVDAMDVLVQMPWSGNIRELRNVIERLIIFCEGERITREDVQTYAGEFL